MLSFVLSVVALSSVVFGIPRTFAPSHFLSITVSDKTCNVMDYGAKGDGKSDDTSAVQDAIDDCISGSSSSTPGGTVYFPSSHSFLLYPITINDAKYGLSFYVNSGSTILLNSDISKWPGSTNFIQIHSSNNIVMSGGGTIDGQGQVWWDCYNSNSDCYRPDMVYASTSVDTMLVEQLTLKNSPKFHLSLGGFHTEITGVTITAPSDSPNTDAIDPNNNEFYIHNNYISVGDDNVAIKNGNDSLIENNQFGTGHGASIGSLDGDCWIKNITFRDITFQNTTNGARIKSKPGSKNGKVSDITYENLAMSGVENPIVITQYYESSSTKTSYLYFDSITISNLTSYYSQHPGTFTCQPSTPCTNFVLKDVYVSSNNKKEKVTVEHLRQTSSSKTRDVSAYEFDCENVSGTCSNVTPSCCFSRR